jgi:hypothetical protein
MTDLRKQRKPENAGLIMGKRVRGFFFFFFWKTLDSQLHNSYYYGTEG